MKKEAQSLEVSAWIQFLTTSENSIMRDAGKTLALLTGNSLCVQTDFAPLAQKSLKEWEQALLLAECLKFSENDNLVETSRIIFEWFSANFQSDLHE